MTIKDNEETAQNKQVDLTKKISQQLREYGDQIDKTTTKKIEKFDHNNLNKIIAHIDYTYLLLGMLEYNLQNPKAEKTSAALHNYLTSRNNLVSSGNGEFINKLALLDNVQLVDQLKENIEKIDYLARNTYLSPRLDKIYEAIKTLLSNLIALFVPFEGRHVINEATQALTSARSALFSQIKTLKNSLNSPEPQTETPMIGLPQPRI